MDEIQASGVPAIRSPSGRFVPGQSGNPAGRPAILVLLKDRSEEAQLKLLKLMRSRDEKIAFQAVQLVLAYCVGKPRERFEHSGVLTLEQLLTGSWDEKPVDMIRPQG